MATVPRNDNVVINNKIRPTHINSQQAVCKYNLFEEAIRMTWKSYTDAFLTHADVQCNLYGICMLAETKDDILHDTLNDSVGFMGWWLFSLTANCPVDVMPLHLDYSKVTIRDKLNEEKWHQYSIAKSRENHLKIAVALLRAYALRKQFKHIDDVLAVIREALE
jgi:hypothetical protein